MYKVATSVNMYSKDKKIIIHQILIFFNSIPFLVNGFNLVVGRVSMA